MVKKSIIFLCFLFSVKIFFVSANDFVELRTRLARINAFYAHFIQKVTDSSGVILQENTGELWVQYPRFFHYHVIFPEESYLVSNGETLWFYDPGLNQVIITWLKDVFDNAFLLLLSDIAELRWCEYYINRQEDSFFLIPKKTEDVAFKKIEIIITHKGVIKKIEILNGEDHNIKYQLIKYNACYSFDKNKFYFHPPDGVVIDEQR